MALVMLAAPAVSHASGIEALERLGAILQTSAVWQADYTQEYVAAGMQSGDRVAGKVWVAWPDRALFETGEPVTQKMGLDGRIVRLVDLGVPSCDEHQLSDDEWERIPLAAVLDPGSAVERFTVLDHDGAGFVLVPREPGGVDRVEVALDSRDLPSEVVIVDPQGAVNRLQFSSWRPADPPASNSWLPEPPPALECVRDN
jgi:hypothetical protein